MVDKLTRRADHLTPPFRLFPCCNKPHYEDDHALAEAILLQCQFFALQFVFFRPLTTIAKVLLNKYEYYGPWADGPNDWRAPQVYVTVIQNISIFTAFAGLLKFYHAVDKDLEWCRPFAKFLCIKGVVFMTFWQGLAITILAETTDVGGADSSDSEEWAMSAQNFLICLEMLLFSIAHFYCFPTYEWEPNYRVEFNKAKYGIKETLALGDFMSDLKLIMLKGNSKKKLRSSSTSKRPSEPSVPEEEVEDDDADDGGDVDDEATILISDTTGNTSACGSPNRSLAEDVANILADESDIDNPEQKELKRRINSFLNDTAFLPGDIMSRRESNNDLLSANSAINDTKSRGDTTEKLGHIRSDEDLHEYQEEEVVDEAIRLAAGVVDGQEVEEYGTNGDGSNGNSASLPYGSGNTSQEESSSFQGIDWAKDEDDDDEEEPTETTGLVRRTSAAPSSLNPSIFTKIADISHVDNTTEKESSDDDVK